MFVPKKDGTLCLCVNYWALNRITIKNRYPLPLIGELIDRLLGAKIFTKLDLKDAYHRIRIKAGDEWKTAFRTRYGHFEYLVMPFGLTNAPATFQAYINKALSGLLDTICVVYLDDIVVYSNDYEAHTHHVRMVLERLREYELYINLKKCSFHVTSIDFLGFIVSVDGVSMEKSRVDAIREWPYPTTFREVQVFLGTANFYRRFIIHYLRVILLITNLLKGSKNGKKPGPFVFGEAAKQAMDRLKDLFTSAPILIHFCWELRIHLETDASGFALGAIIS